MQISDLDLGWTAEQVHKIVVAQFPQFAGQTPTILGRGWDNVCIIYPDSTVFRLPTRQLGGDIMAIESVVLPHFDQLLPLSVPKYRYFGEPTLEYPWKFVGYAFLTGTTADRLDWTPTQRQQAAFTVGNFLRVLHSLQISPELAKVLPPDLIDRTSSHAILKRIEKYSAQIIESYPERKAWAQDIRNLAFEIGSDVMIEPKLCLVHGDLYPRHLLADKDHKIVGVIDWGDVHLGHPFLDLSIVYTFFDQAEREEFWRAYELPVSPEMKMMARLKAINYALALYLYGRHSEDENLVGLCDLIGPRSASIES